MSPSTSTTTTKRYPSTLSTASTSSSSSSSTNLPFESPYIPPPSTSTSTSPTSPNSVPPLPTTTTTSTTSSERKVSATTRARHSRRPSRAERYEGLVLQARQVLERGMGLSSSGGGGGDSSMSISGSRRNSLMMMTKGGGQEEDGITRRSSITTTNDSSSIRIGSSGRRISRGGGSGSITSGSSLRRTSWSGIGGFEVGLGIDQFGEESSSPSATTERRGGVVGNRNSIGSGRRSSIYQVDEEGGAEGEGGNRDEEGDDGYPKAVREREWRDTVRSLLLVVDGMSQQLATHDELAAQLKIAQSNLTLAETHSEFLEETLKRRSQKHDIDVMVNGLGDTTTTGTGAQQHRTRGGGRVRTGTDDGSLMTTGTGTATNEESTTSTSTNGGGARGFFRLPTTSSTSNTLKRKPTNSTSSILPPSFTGGGTAPALRSVASSPRLGGGNSWGMMNDSTTPLPPSTSPNPDQPRTSTSTIASFDGTRPPLSLSPNPSFLSNSEPTDPSSYQHLQLYISQLETDNVALKTSKESLKLNYDRVVEKCAGLEKTQEDLMSELENLSVELFSEANALVAEERRARAQAETQVETLRSQLATLTGELDTLRSVLAHRRLLEPLDITSPDLPAIPSRNDSISSTTSTTLSGLPSLSLPPHNQQPSPTNPSSPNPDYSPSGTTATNANPRPQSSASTGRKWFSFGRSPSTPTAPPTPTMSTSATSVGTASPNPSFSTPPLSGPGSNQTTPLLSLSPYLNTPVPSSSSSTSISIPAPTSESSSTTTSTNDSTSLALPKSNKMERNNSGSSYVTARSESWFGFGGGGGGSKGSRMGGAGGGGQEEVSEEPEEMEGNGLLSVKNLDDERDEQLEEIQTPVRSEFGDVQRKNESKVSPRPLKKEPSTSSLSPSRPKKPVEPLPPPPPSQLRAPSPSPSHVTTMSTSTLSSSIDKDLPTFIASPPLPPLPPATPAASALSSPVVAAIDTFETDPLKLPFASSTSTAPPPPPLPFPPPSQLRQNRNAAPRPLAIHVATSSPSNSPSNLSSARSPASASFLPFPTSAPIIASNPSGGGPRTPTSPNDLRWREASSSLDATGSSKNATTSPGLGRSRTRSTESSKENHRRESGGHQRDSRSTIDKRDILPPSPRSSESPVMRGGGGPPSSSSASSTHHPKPLPQPSLQQEKSPSVPSKPLPFSNPTSTTQFGGGGGGLRIDTTGLPSPSGPTSSFSTSSVTPRPTNAGPRSAQPRQSNDGPSSRPSLFRHASSSTTSRGITPSGSQSSIASQQSTNSSTASTTNHSWLPGRSSTNALRSGSLTRRMGGVDRPPTSADGTKAVEDLDKLMESMMDMFEGDESK